MATATFKVWRGNQDGGDFGTYEVELEPVATYVSPEPAIARLGVLGNDIYVVGTTASTSFPVTDGAYDTALGGDADAFVARFSADLTTLIAATYLGGDLTEFDDPATDQEHERGF